MECDKCKGNNLEILNRKTVKYDTLNPNNDKRIKFEEMIEFKCLICGNVFREYF